MMFSTIFTGRSHDLYMRRRADIATNLSEARSLLEALEGKADLVHLLQSPVVLMLEVAALRVTDAEQVDESDLCSLLIREWPIAPCNTPREEYSGMVSTG